MQLKSLAAALVLSLAASSAYANDLRPNDKQQASTTVVKPGKHIDSLWNGALIGAGVGAVGAWIFTRVNCGPAGYDKECTAIAGPVGTLVFVPAGAIGGAIIDRMINKTLPAGATARTSIAPLLSEKGARKSAGVAVKVQIQF